MQSEINTALEILNKGGILLYPTDTVWGIGCDATNKNAVAKIYALKNREESKSMICLVNNTEMLGRHLQKVPKKALDIIKQSQNPTTIIYDAPKNIASNLIAKDNTLAIRIVNHSFCNALIEKLQNPLVSTSANISGDSCPKDFKEISEHILKGVDYVVNLPSKKTTIQPSTIIKINNDGAIEIIRK